MYNDWSAREGPFLWHSAHGVTREMQQDPIQVFSFFFHVHCLRIESAFSGGMRAHVNFPSVLSDAVACNTRNNAWMQCLVCASRCEHRCSFVVLLYLHKCAGPAVCMNRMCQDSVFLSIERTFRFRCRCRRRRCCCVDIFWETHNSLLSTCICCYDVCLVEANSLRNTKAWPELI